MLRAARHDARPFALLGAWSGGGALVGSDPLVTLENAEDPFAALDQQPEVSGCAEGATGGGWVGYLGYGLGRLVERLPSQPPYPVAVPASVLAFYDHLLHRDAAGTWWFEALWSDEQSDRLEARLEGWQRRAAEPEQEPGEFRCGPFRPIPAPEAHLVSVSRAIEHVRSGDVFQINVCNRLEADFSGDPIELFCAGAGSLEPRFGAYMGHPSIAVASFSPELFLRRVGRHVLSSPIKGTARRECSSAKERDRLLDSGKDRAENVMIVDLVRNDLGRVCRYGTVAVPEMCRPEEHPGVWHLVSDVTGELSREVHDGDLLRATFPPGSVTGAPKVRAMELIAALEPTARGVYTGAVGIASPVSGLELNVAIRTFEMASEKVWLGVGGGVVADSDPDRELAECLDKARPLLTAIGADLDPALSRPKGALPRHAVREWGLVPDTDSGVFETMLVAGGRAIELESHLARLAESVSCLFGSRPSARLGAEVAEVAAMQPGPRRLRVRVYRSPDGSLATEVSVSPAPGAFSGRPGTPAALVPVVLPGGLGRHKWNDRRILEDRRKALGLRSNEQLLLVDVDGSVLETERANVFAVSESLVTTPPADGRIRPGTTGETAIRAAKLLGLEFTVQALTVAELDSAEEVFLTSSIAGVTPVTEIRGGSRWASGRVSARLAQVMWELWQRPAGTSQMVDSLRSGADETNGGTVMDETAGTGFMRIGE